jgi:hypothetical protein
MNTIISDFEELDPDEHVLIDEDEMAWEILSSADSPEGFRELIVHDPHSREDVPIHLEDTDWGRHIVEEDGTPVEILNGSNAHWGYKE